MILANKTPSVPSPHGAPKPEGGERQTKKPKLRTERTRRHDGRRGSDQALRELSPSLGSSILNVPSCASPLNVVSESVICVVVVDLKTIGPVERVFPPVIFDGIE